MEAIEFFNERINELNEDIQYYKESIDAEKRTVNSTNGHIKIFYIKSLEKNLQGCYRQIGFYRQAINAMKEPKVTEAA
ncbi:hypothetical protein [Flagellimonas sp. SN16]|uniref:hypothetical protein n=1 Tax=Flagellimonas sp. SN16 TaxID=3415142 RepID=UPI003C338799